MRLLRRLFLCCLALGIRGRASGQSALPSTSRGDGSVAVALGACRITVVEQYAWRDWMPIVQDPGADGGSPLYAKISFRVENKGTKPVKLAWRAAFVDAKGETVAASFRIQADFHGNWDGTLKPGERRQVDYITHEGPRWPAGSTVRIETTWTDADGNSTVIRSPETRIERTD